MTNGEKKRKHTGFKPTTFGKPRIRKEGSETLICWLKVIKFLRDASVGGEDASEALSRGQPGFGQDDCTTKTVQSGDR